MACQKQKKMRDFRDDRPHLRSEGFRKSKGLENRLLRKKCSKKGVEWFRSRSKKGTLQAEEHAGLVKSMQKIAGNSAFAMAA